MFQSLKAKAPRQTHTHTHFSHTYRNHRHTLSTHKTYTHTVRDMARGEKGGDSGRKCTLSKGRFGRVQGEFGAAQEGLLARRRNRRRLIHAGCCHGDGGSGRHGGGGQHWPERVEGGRNGRQRGDGGHRRQWAWGLIMNRGVLWVLGELLVLLIVLRVVPERERQRHTHTRLKW